MAAVSHGGWLGYVSRVWMHNSLALARLASPACLYTYLQGREVIGFKIQKTPRGRWAIMRTVAGNLELKSYLIFRWVR